MDFAAKLEAEQDPSARADMAKKCIDENDGMKEISYNELGAYLANPKTASPSVWRKLYVLERSIAPRFGNKYTWLERLKIFYNTFIRESAVVNGAHYRGKKLYFLNGGKNRQTNHDKLVYGHGQWGADFYFYDDSIPSESAWDKMVKVEMKHGNYDVASEVSKHANDKFLYNAKHMILAMADGSYFMVDYTATPPATERLDISCNDTFMI